MSETCVSLWFLFQIPKYIRKGKDIQVVIEKKHIQVSHKDETGSTVELMEGELCWEINKEESMWNLVPGEHILVGTVEIIFWEDLLYQITFNVNQGLLYSVRYIGLSNTTLLTTNL
jgi:hypothetical protein